MILKTLSVKNFRNIKAAEFCFHDKINMLTGNNAQGKTNLMEAISLCFGRSFRDAQPEELVPFSEKNEQIEITLTFTFDKQPEKINTLAYTQRGGKKRLLFNEIDIKSAVQLYGALRYVVFIPEDLYIVKGNPQKRRDYIDNLTDMINLVHQKRLYEYNKALRQKNNLLMKLGDNCPDYVQAQLDSWNENLARLGVNVMCGRLKYFDTLCSYADEIYSALNQNNERLSLEYNGSAVENAAADSNPDELYRSYYTALLNSAERERRMKYTVVGAHRDDISFYINNMPAKDFASQGQIRSIALALKLSEARMINDRADDFPVVILDDVLSELDEYRRNFVIQHIDNFQVFITCCNINELDKITDGKAWAVNNGEFTQL